MKESNLRDFRKGWVVGDFVDSLFRTKDVEVAIKRYRKNDVEPKHVHKITKEFTIVVYGAISMNGEIFHEESIIVVEPGESVEFKSITDSITCCIKSPSIPGDKYFE